MQKKKKGKQKKGSSLPKEKQTVKIVIKNNKKSINFLLKGV